MEFLVRIEVRLPADMAEEDADRLRDAELAAGRRLTAAGRIQRIWRLPGRRANVAVWQVPDADALHRELSALPLFPYLDVEVEALATHPIEEADV